jgi:hypothetical protein
VELSECTRTDGEKDKSALIPTCRRHHERTPRSDFSEEVRRRVHVRSSGDGEVDYARALLKRRPLGTLKYLRHEAQVVLVQDLGNDPTNGGRVGDHPQDADTVGKGGERSHDMSPCPKQPKMNDQLV